MNTSTTRKSAVSGTFYPNKKSEIENLLNKILEKEESFIDKKLSGKEIIGGIVPHAGYIYSAYQAIHFFEILKLSKQKFDTVIIINPNHTGYGKPISLDNNNFWETPFGNIEIDKEFSDLTNFSISPEAHIKEHSGEVMLPFLQHFFKFDFKILPITMSVQNIENAKIIANKIFEIENKLNRKIIVIASTDFSHYVNAETGKNADMEIIKYIEEINPELLIQTVKSKRITMCGFGPVATILEYSKLKSKNPKAKLLKFGNSGEINNSDKVVDYASILVFK